MAGPSRSEPRSRRTSSSRLLNGSTSGSCHRAAVGAARACAAGRRVPRAAAAQRLHEAGLSGRAASSSSTTRGPASRNGRTQPPGRVSSTAVLQPGESLVSTAGGVGSEGQEEQRLDQRGGPLASVAAS